MNQTGESSEGVINALTEKIDDVPSLPKVSQRIVSLVNKDDTEIEDLEKALRTDPSLTAHILRFANSRYYGHEKDVTNLKRAVQLLGFNSVRSIALGYGMDHQYTAPEIPGFPRQEFWNYSLAVGRCAEIIADYLGYDSDEKGNAFSAGHLHSVGKPIMDQYLHRDFIKIVKKTDEESVPFYEAEEEVFGFTHCEVGEAVLNEWNLPKVLSSTAGNYYKLSNVEYETTIVVHFATVLVKTKGYGFSGDQDLSYLKEDRVDELGLTDENIESILHDDLPQAYEEMKEMVGME
ncbi:MAG: HDOD domain-containing protein [bacterium]